MRTMIIALALLVAAPAGAQDYRLPPSGGVPTPIPENYNKCISLVVVPGMRSAKGFAEKQYIPPLSADVREALDEARRRKMVILQDCWEKRT